MTRGLSIGLLVAVFVGLVAVALCTPESYTNNDFIRDIMSQGYISILAVIVTVSLVSVTQIHLELSRLERSLKFFAFQGARNAINSGAVALISMLLASFPLIYLAKASVPADEFVGYPTVFGFCVAVAAVIMIAAILIMYDFVRTVYEIAQDDPTIEKSDSD